jgi:hypothetical protein
VTTYQDNDNVVPCFKAGQCGDYDDYDPEFGGEPCCLALRCICGSIAKVNPGVDRCANFASASDTTTYDPKNQITVPTVFYDWQP